MKIGLGFYLLATLTACSNSTPSVFSLSSKVQEQTQSSKFADVDVSASTQTQVISANGYKAQLFVRAQGVDGTLKSASGYQLKIRKVEY